MSGWGTLVVVVGSLGGVALGWIGTMASEKRRDVRAESRDDKARVQARRDQRDEFELTQLAKCREALLADNLATIRSYVGRDTGVKPRTSESDRLPPYELHRVTGLLLDSELRQEVREVGAALHAVSRALSDEGTDMETNVRDFQSALWRCDATFERIAGAMRAIYERM